MELTLEQQAILAIDNNLKINAVAGSGKTTTLVEYARSRPKNSKILYIAFNRSVKLEAERKFAGVPNVQIETAHSLAFHHIVKHSQYKVVPSYKPHEIKEILNLKPVTKEAHSEYTLANHISRFVSFFCNQTADKVQSLDYLSTLSDPQALAFANQFHELILEKTRLFLAKMQKAEIDILHDFYLKKFQLVKPKLHYDYILFDEGQDASAVMLDVFLNQNAKKLIVGDPHQQIYAWRYATNALQQVDFEAHNLSTSFRFDSHIAFLANHYLEWKRHFSPTVPIQIVGAGTSKSIFTKATLARTNLFLLKNAIQAISERKLQKIYFEGNLNTYTYAADGASIYDVLNLYLDKKGMIRDNLLKIMPDFQTLVEYAEHSEEAELQMLIEIVKEYGKELPNLLKELKEKHVEDGQKAEAEMIFSTVHKCKGMEYDEVTLETDFMNETQIKDHLEKGTADAARLNEEINILYVAATRTRTRINLPEKYSPFASINIIKPTENQAVAKKEPEKKNNYLGTTGGTQYYKPWSKEDDQKLADLYQSGAPLPEIAGTLERKMGAIVSRIDKLDLKKKFFG